MASHLRGVAGLNFRKVNKQPNNSLFMAKLAEIIEDEDKIFILDGSARGHSDFCWENYEGWYASSLDITELKKEIEGVTKFDELLKDHTLPGKIVTTPGITKELETYARIITDNIQFLTLSQPTFRGNIDPRTRKRAGKRIEQRWHCDKKMQDMSKLYGVLQSCAYHSEEAELKITDMRYTLLFEAIKTISETLHLKHDTSQRLGRRTEDKSYYSYVDEEITATLYWLSLFTDWQPALITRDTDFFPLIKTTRAFLGSGGFGDYLTQNPITVYMGSRDHDKGVVEDVSKTEFNRGYNSSFPNDLLPIKILEIKKTIAPQLAALIA